MAEDPGSPFDGNGSQPIMSLFQDKQRAAPSGVMSGDVLILVIRFCQPKAWRKLTRCELGCLVWPRQRKPFLEDRLLRASAFPGLEWTIHRSHCLRNDENLRGITESLVLGGFTILLGNSRLCPIDNVAFHATTHWIFTMCQTPRKTLYVDPSI